MVVLILILHSDLSAKVIAAWIFPKKLTVSFRYFYFLPKLNYNSLLRAQGVKNYSFVSNTLHPTFVTGFTDASPTKQNFIRQYRKKALQQMSQSTSLVI